MALAVEQRPPDASAPTLAAGGKGYDARWLLHGPRTHERPPRGFDVHPVSTMKYRRWLPRFDPGLRTTVNLSETYRDHALHVFVSRAGPATMTCAVYVDGNRVAFEVVLGTEPEVLIQGMTTALRVIDEMLAGLHAEVDEAVNDAD